MARLVIDTADGRYSDVEPYQLAWLVDRCSVGIEDARCG
jgi:hypothetical protein